jgi:hypothetical protein
VAFMWAETATPGRQKGPDLPARILIYSRGANFKLSILTRACAAMAGPCARAALLLSLVLACALGGERRRCRSAGRASAPSA